VAKRVRERELRGYERERVFRVSDFVSIMEMVVGLCELEG
jgi:hypothetical protein